MGWMFLWSLMANFSTLLFLSTHSCFALLSKTKALAFVESVIFTDSNSLIELI
jgi:hypothetical protein